MENGKIGKLFLCVRLSVGKMKLFQVEIQLNFQRSRKENCKQHNDDDEAMKFPKRAKACNLFHFFVCVLFGLERK